MDDKLKLEMLEILIKDDPELLELTQDPEFSLDSMEVYLKDSSYDIYMKDETVGYENRIKLFNEISQDVWGTLYCNDGRYDYDDFLEKYMNDVSCFANSLCDFKILMYFALERSNVDISSEKQNMYKKIAMDVLSTMNRFEWIEFYDIEEDEAMLLERLHNG